MRADLDRLMAEQNLDAFLVLGDSAGNPILRYLTGGAHLERALAVKRRGGPLTLIHGSMERDNVAHLGLDLIDRDQRYNFYQLLQKHDGNHLNANVDYLSQVVADLGLQGRLGVYGRMEAGEAYVLLSHLADRLPETELVGEMGDSLFTRTRETKDGWEMAELAEAGRISCIVVGEIQEFIQSHRVRGDWVVDSQGDPLTIGLVKGFMRQRLHHYGMADSLGTIFAQGVEATAPHNPGGPETPLQLGKTIIFDFFPLSQSGYFHDLTRTWCLGYAPDPVWAVYEQVKAAFDLVMNSLQVGELCRSYQERVCELFESQGHPTVRSHPGTHEGYVHGLGHGIGLDIHEAPLFSHSPSNNARLQPGHVVTIEPGLYFPDREFGVRIEDTVAINEAGEVVWLTQYPYDLVIPVGTQGNRESYSFNAR